MNNVSQLQKGFPTTTVQAGLVLVLAAILSACADKSAPVEAAPLHLAATAVDAGAQVDDLPVVTITAPRELAKKEG